MIGLLIQLTIALMGGDGVEVTFERQIRPIIAKHCSRCHQPDQGTPFSLLTYRDVRKRSRQILAVVESRFMPPWLPAPGDEPFVGARRLSRSEIDLIRSWVAGGAREGQQVEPRDGPSGPSGPSMSGLGAPDVVLTSTEPLVVPAEGLGVVHTLVRSIPDDAPRYLRAIEFRPSNPRVLHGALFLCDTTGYATKFDESTPEPGYPAMGSVGLNLAGSLGGWAIGVSAFELPPGYGWPIAPDSVLSLQVHLNPIGRPVPFTFEVGLFATRHPVRHPVTAIGLANVEIDIAPGETDHVIEASYQCPVDVRLLGLLPSAHLVGQKMRVTAEDPEGSIRSLLCIEDWDMNWQQPYYYRQPIRLAKGTRVRMVYHYDNSLTNPQNPSSPPRRVTIGEAPDGEIAVLLLYVAPERFIDFETLERSHVEQLSEQLKKRPAVR